MVHTSILSQLNYNFLLKSGYIISERNGDVEHEDEEEVEENENEEDEEKDGKSGDVHEGGERMPDIDNIFRREDDFSFAECY